MTRLRTLAVAGAMALAMIAAMLSAPAQAQGQPADRFLVATWGETSSSSWGSRSDLVSIARRHIGATARDLHLPRSLWCGDFVNLVRKEAGLSPVPSRLARDQARGGRHLSEPRPGAVVVLSRGRGGRAGHTGIISAVTPSGDLVVISGNHRRHVAEAVYPRWRVVAFVDPVK